MVWALLLLLFACSWERGRAVGGEWQLPLAEYTPGALNENVTEATMACTICTTVSGCQSNWTTAKIRPPSSFTTLLKARQLAGPYASFVERWGDELDAYEEDHLVPLEIGGHPRSVLNLWPQPRKSAQAAEKDALEDRLSKLVCAGTVPLREAQHAIAQNWSAAYQKYM